jgi:predicted GNAT family acetyltransferase
MRAIRHHDLAAFRARVTPLLVTREAENNLPLGLLAAVHQTPPLLVEVCDEGGAPLAVAMQTPPFNLIITDGSLAMMDAIAERLDADGVVIPGVIGPRVPARHLAARWSREQGLPLRCHHEMRIFQCATLIPPRAPRDGGSARVASSADLPLVHAWCVAFASDTNTSVPPRPEETERRVRAGDFWLWETDRPVAMAAVSRRTPNGAGVAYVYTPPELRGRGYASGVVAALTGHELAAGHGCFLYTDVANPTSNKIYQALGYAPVCDVEEWRFD